MHSEEYRRFHQELFLRCPSKEANMTSSLVFRGIIIPIICVMGLFGNAIALTILLRRHLGSMAFLSYLRSLCLADSGLLISALFMFTLPLYTEGYPDVNGIVSKMVLLFYPLGLTCQTMSCWMITAMTLVRYLGVKYPLVWRQFSTPEIVRSIIAGVLVSASLYNIPRLLELKTLQCFSSAGNLTSIIIATTTLRENSEYKLIYMGINYTVLMLALPFATLLVLNILIVRLLSKDTPYIRRTSSRQSQEQTRLITTLLAMISGLFLISNTLPFVVNLLELKIGDVNASTSRPLLEVCFIWLTDVGNLLVCANASCNFFIYLLFNGRFRTRCAKALRRTAGTSEANQNTNIPGSSMYTNRADGNTTMTTILSPSHFRRYTQVAFDSDVPRRISLL